MTRVLIAEKQTLIRKMLQLMLKADSDFEVVAEAADGGMTIERLQQSDIDLLIMNISMPGTSGVDLIVRAKAVNPKLSILVFSMSSDTQLVTLALKSGAGGYISTMHEPDEFKSALRKVASGGRYIDSAIAEGLLIESISGNDKPRHSCLSQRELEIFRLLVEGKVANEIANLLIISNKTVSSHKKKIMVKMHFSSIAELMRYAVQHKLFDDGDVDGLNQLTSNRHSTTSNTKTSSS